MSGLDEIMHIMRMNVGSLCGAYCIIEHTLTEHVSCRYPRIQIYIRFNLLSLDLNKFSSIS